MRDDPRRMTARFPSTCGGGEPDEPCEIEKGDEIVYWPRTRTAVCLKHGEADFRESMALTEDEDLL